MKNFKIKQFELNTKDGVIEPKNDHACDARIDCKTSIIEDSPTNINTSVSTSVSQLKSMRSTSFEIENIQKCIQTLKQQIDVIETAFRQMDQHIQAPRTKRNINVPTKDRQMRFPSLLDATKDAIKRKPDPIQIFRRLSTKQEEISQTKTESQSRSKHGLTSVSES